MSSSMLGIIFAVIIIFVVKKIQSKHYFKLLDVEIEHCGDEKAYYGAGHLYDVTLRDLKTNERMFFKKITIAPSLWHNIRSVRFKHVECTLCVEMLTEKTLDVFAVKFKNGNDYAFIKDLFMKYNMKQIWSFSVLTVFLLWIMWLFRAYQGFEFILSFMVVTAINYIINAKYRISLLEKQLAIIKEAGISKPLG